MKNCPVCTTEMLVADHKGIQIDHCPRCRGVWLDRGELDKIIERSTQYAGDDRDDDSDWGEDRRGQYSHQPPQHGGYPQGGYPQGQYPRKKKGFFSRMFDFD